MNQITVTASVALLAGEAGFDPIEDRLRTNVRATIEAVFEEELASFLGRLRYHRSDGPAKGCRHGHRERQLTGTFGTETVRVPRARIEDETGKVTEWRSKALPRYRRLTKKAEALIAAVYLAGTNTRRVKRALFGLFEGAVSKDVVSRAWRKVKVDRDAWCARDLAGEDIVRARHCPRTNGGPWLALDGTVIRTRLDRKATNISVLAAIGVRRDGQKVLLSIRSKADQKTVQWTVFPPNGRREHFGLAPVPRRPRRPRPEAARIRDRRRRPGAGGRADRAVGGRPADPALHGAQASQPPRPRAQAPA